MHEMKMLFQFRMPWIISKLHTCCIFSFGENKMAVKKLLFFIWMWIDALKIVLKNSHWLLQLKVRPVQKIDKGHVYAMKSSQKWQTNAKNTRFHKIIDYYN